MSTTPEQDHRELDTCMGEDVACSHCGLPVPAGLINSDSPLQFCCHGCQTVYEMIHGCGMDRFYRLRDATGAASPPARVTDLRYRELDDPVFRNLYYQTLPDGTQSTELYLEGVHCSACVWLVEKLPMIAPGVLEARLDIRRSLVRIRWDDSQVALSHIARTLNSLGYPPHPAKDARARQQRRREDQRFLIRIGVAAACAGNVMTLAFALYGGMFTGIEDQYSQLFRLTSMGFGLIALLWPGSLFFRGAWAALRTRTAHLDLPIAIGLLAGSLAGTVNAIRGAGEIYFDSLTMLILMLLAGRWIQRRQQRWAGDAIELLFSLTPTSARRVTESGIEQVPLEAIVPGDVVEVRAGDSIPTDGQVLEGRSTIDQSLLTGESHAVPVAPGQAVHAGTVNLSARLLVQVQQVGEQTRVGRLMRLVEQCSQRRAPIVLLADRIAGWFVLVVLVLAVLTFGLWMVWDSSRAVDHAVALLIVTCPCALGMATPLAVTVALGRAARRKILIKGGEILEVLSRPGMVVLDKTGTLTASRTSVLQWSGDDAVLPSVAALQRHSAHPIATALVQFCEQRIGLDRAAAAQATEVQQTMGAGLAGTIDGHHVVIGSARFVRQMHCRIDHPMLQAEQAALDQAATPVLVAVDRQVIAVAALGDPIRDDAAQALNQLRQMGWKVRILSGDHPSVVRAVAQQLDVAPQDAVGGATPEDKVQYVEQAARQGPTVMVGDGVNDAAALSAATVGIAVHGGAEASLAAADVYLSRSGLIPVVEVIQAARNTLHTIRRCLTASLCYNALAASLAIIGWIGPLTAALLMPISSFTVLTLAFTSRTFGDRS
ncbi:MAG: heavy metal translocating P-type ATPase [Planctomycetaceae bacterium]|nr:MAG: heavy metal translocating P-type ATPase [Planctomycetaceae bacterium]